MAAADDNGGAPAGRAERCKCWGELPFSLWGDVHPRFTPTHGRVSIEELVLAYARPDLLSASSRVYLPDCGPSLVLTVSAELG